MENLKWTQSTLWHKTTNTFCSQISAYTICTNLLYKY